MILSETRFQNRTEMSYLLLFYRDTILTTRQEPFKERGQPAPMRKTSFLMIFWSENKRVPTSKLSFEAPGTNFFDRLDIFSDGTNLKIILTVFVSALPAPQAAREPQIAQT